MKFRYGNLGAYFLFAIFSTFTAMKVLIINGPNLNLLGTREPGTYGTQNFNSYFETLKEKFQDHELTYFQSNIEGEIITRIQEADSLFDGIVLNAAAYTHTSVGIGDAVKAISIPVIEVHISNTYAREDFRRRSFIAANAKGVIIGFGLQSYDLAIFNLISA